MDNIRTVYVDSPVPEDSPAEDLHIWSAAATACFEAWWLTRGKPFWVGVDATHGTLKDAERVKLLKSLKTAADQGATVVIYTSRMPTDADAPCGCHGYDSHCDYHCPADRSDNSAACFCCSILDFVCSYHRID